LRILQDCQKGIVHPCNQQHTKMNLNPSPTGNPIAPVIKLSSNTVLYNKMRDIIDINTGTIIEGEETIEQAGERILDYVIKVASGELEISAVRHGQDDFIPWKRGVSL